MVLSKNNLFNQTQITGLGCITPAGLGVDPFWQAIIEDKTYLSADERGFCLGRFSDSQKSEIISKWHNTHEVSTLKTKLSGYSNDFGVALTLEAASQAIAQAGWQDLDDKTGIIFATTTGQIPVWESSLLKYLRNELNTKTFAQEFKHQPLALILDQLATALGATGPRQLVTSACAASTQAMILADLWLKTGKVKRCLVGGTELLCELTIRGFNGFQLLSGQPAKPFDAQRQGINLSEAAAFICLEASSTNSLAALSGGGMSTDAFHMTSPEPNGSGSQRALHAALMSAGLEPQQIDWVYAHGTGSEANDRSESAAVTTVFGNDVPVTSTKGVHGHTLAISGVLETIVAVRALRENVLLGTYGFNSPGSAIQARINVKHTSRTLNHVVKNTLGFGGTNASVILSRVRL